MQTLYMVPERDMRKYNEILQRGSGLTEMQTSDRPIDVIDVAGKREAAEAFTALSLDKLTSEILARADISEWTKAQMLSDNLQRFLAHKAQAFPEESVIPSLPPLLPSAPIMPSFNPDLSSLQDGTHTDDLVKRKKRQTEPKSGITKRPGKITKSATDVDLNSSKRASRVKQPVDYKAQMGKGELVVHSLPRWIVI